MAKEQQENLILRILDITEVTIVSIALLVMTVVVFLQVFFRYVIHASLPWSEELARYVMIWAVFVGSSIGARQGVHIGVEALVRTFPLPLRKVCIVVSGLISVSFCAIVTYLSYIVIGFLYDMGQISPALEMPMYYAYLAIPIGCVMMGIRFFQATLISLKKANEVKS